MQLKLLIALVLVTLAVASPAEVAPTRKNEIDSRGFLGDFLGDLFGPSDPPPLFIPGFNKVDGRDEKTIYGPPIPGPTAR